MKRPAAWLLAIACLALALLLVRSIFAVPYLPTNDGPEHVFFAHLENHYADSGAPYSLYFLPALEYAAHGFAFLYTPLEALLGWQPALSVALAGISVATALGFVALVLARSPGRWPVALLGFPLALSWPLYMGFFPFTVGSAVGLFVVALAVAWRAESRAQTAALALLLFLQAICHVFTAALTGLVVAALLVARAERRPRAAARVALLGAPAALILALTIANGGSQTARAFSPTTEFQPPLMTLLELPRLLTPGPLWRALAVGALLLLAVTTGTLSLVGKRSSPSEIALLGAGVGLLLLGVCAPIHIPGWQFFSPRFLPLGLALSVSSLPVERFLPARRQARLAVGATFFVCAAVSLLASARFHRRLATATSDSLAALEAPVTRQGMWLPLGLAPEGGLTVDPVLAEVPFLKALFHIQMLFAVVEGGLTPYTVAVNGANSPFVIRPDGPRTPPVPIMERYSPLIESDAFEQSDAFRTPVLDDLATYGMFYEGVLVTGARPSDRAFFRRRGFVPDVERGSVMVAHFVPCPLTIEVAGSDAYGDAVLIDVGVGSSTVFRDQRPVTRDGAAALSVTLPNAPCGDIWVRGHRGPSASRAGRPAQACRGANARGELALTLGHDGGRVRCELDRPAVRAE